MGNPRSQDETVARINGLVDRIDQAVDDHLRKFAEGNDPASIYSETMTALTMVVGRRIIGGRESYGVPCLMSGVALAAKHMAEAGLQQLRAFEATGGSVH